MTGMKEGAGEDPFADDDERDDDPVESSEKEIANAPVEAVTNRRGTSSQARGQQQAVQIPYKFRRDGVQDGRDRVPLFLKPATKRAERDARSELEERFDDQVSLTDLREAAVITGLQHLNEVQGQLEDWGYGMTFTE